MKRLFIIYIFINIVKGDIDISKYIGSSDEIPLKVINIPLKGVLNLKNRAHHLREKIPLSNPK